MCGIAGYVGYREAIPIVLDQLRRLEYRGYDSAGVAVVGSQVSVVKTQGKLQDLEALLAGGAPDGGIAIAHTRWATHGKPSTANAHPHADSSGMIVVCHNGIIENYLELRERLQARGCEFASETDTETLPHLIAHHFRECGDLETAMRAALREVRGSYALAVASAHQPDAILVARRDSPLVIGLGVGEYFVASDIPAVLPYTRDVLLLEDGDFGLIRRDGVRLSRLDQDAPVDRPVMTITWEPTAAEKEGFAHFMLKEIHEQPRSIRDTLRGRIVENRVELPELRLDAEAAGEIERMYLVGCGTAYHAGLVAAQTWERRLRIPVTAELASEFRYRDPVLSHRTLVVLISQSGETADTLAAMREARARGARAVAVVNVAGSTLAREADCVLHTQAGPEISVASTKAYTSQLAALALLGIHLARLRGVMPAEEERRLTAALERLPSQAACILGQAEMLEAIAADLGHCRDFFFLGRGLDYAVAQEGALKLKEISYRHSEALAAGEMKHGTLALVTSDVTAVCLLTQPSVREKCASNIKEVKAREAFVVTVARESDLDAQCDADRVVPVPDSDDILMPILAIIPLQLLAYYIARDSGCEIDQPRNLAKSVTVE